VIPDQVEAEFDIRFTEEFNKDEILQFVRRIADRFD
jgi:acetylornithine deacetylase/succinyl-diaminopimelate desuccinylase-like protein